MLEPVEFRPKNSKSLEDYDPTLDLPHYKMPTIDLLEKHDSENSTVTNEELVSNKNKIVETLAHYKIQIDKIKATIGPTVTLYEIVPAPGVRISKIKSLEDDIALSLAALGIRIIAPMPGKGTIGIEVPNQNPEIVSMRSVLSSRKFQDNNFELPVAMGKTISNETYVFDLAKMPHLLLAGATGQGKSVGLNCIITSLLYKKHPSQLKFVLIDPKRVELTAYTSLEKHYLAKIPDAEEVIITDTKKVIYTLNSLTIEMDQRYQLLEKAAVRNIREYNNKFIKRQLNPEKGHRYLPYIVVIVDEFADLIMTAGKEVETPLGPSGTVGAGHWHPSGNCHTTSHNQYYYRGHQGQFPGPYCIQGNLHDRFPDHSRFSRCQPAGWSWRHAVCTGQRYDPYSMCIYRCS